MSLDLRTAPITSGFGTWPLWRKNAGLQWHAANDFAADLGTPILAPDDGKVVYSGYGMSLGTLGYYTIFDGGDYGLLMAHQDAAYPALVRDGVKRGEVIGYTGNTGWSTGPHLHLVMSVKRFRNGFFDFTREGGGLVDSHCYWNVGYQGDIWRQMFNLTVRPGTPWGVVTQRFVTKSELSLMPVETATIQQGGRWLIYSPAAPSWVSAEFPAVVPDTMALWVTASPEQHAKAA